jgi:hypothetical protein
MKIVLMLENKRPMIAGHLVPLSTQAGWLIQQGMFDADGGRYSGL